MTTSPKARKIHGGVGEREVPHNTLPYRAETQESKAMLPNLFPGMTRLDLFPSNSSASCQMPPGLSTVALHGCDFHLLPLRTAPKLPGTRSSLDGQREQSNN